ncbi:hypothetical protein Glove_543g37 [Diversispora epigaea]|uniref:Protein kinase domain-containing protein n=1 Tax=Diversispora epigaea TaxID=1348612 RepID=A0A397GI01_9GLOM|nr:hypothetical protein Glove_543g37 [Diversispora epigaea]
MLERFGRQSTVLKRLNNMTLSFTLVNTHSFLALCYGLTKDPTTQDFMLVLNYYDNDLRHFLKDNYHSLKLFQKYQIIKFINKIQYTEIYTQGIFYIMKKGFADIYSMGMLMWEVITSETPLDDCEHDLELTLDIVKGSRPKIYEYIPHEYGTLMKQCWDVNPENRPDAIIIYYKLRSLINNKNKIFNLKISNQKSKISLN